jgi:hypothetical protein
MNRRSFIKSGLQNSVAYTLLASTILGSHETLASGRRSADADVTEDEIAHLEYVREEEKLARDVYLTLFDYWGLGVFSRIAESEQTHTDAVRAKIEKYDLADPVTDDRVGVFVNHDLQVLYDALIEQGARSEEEALWVGCAIEEIDMIDLQDAIDHAEHRDIARTYQNLMLGSESHLRAFVDQLESRGVAYVPRYISQEEAEEILGTA